MASPPFNTGFPLPMAIFPCGNNFPCVTSTRRTDVSVWGGWDRDLVGTCRSRQPLADPQPGTRLEPVSDSSPPTAAATPLSTPFPETWVCVRHHCNLTFHRRYFCLLGMHLFKFCRHFFFFLNDLFIFFMLSDISSGTVEAGAFLFHLALLTTPRQ